ncbi:hypothetical protein BCR33DRAFT_815012, partial [Rhizoclosmatium globosum]
VFHNECSFAAYNGKKLLWMEKGEKVLQKKGDGKTVMGTVFIRPCHGLFYKVCIEQGRIQMTTGAVRVWKSKQGQQLPCLTHCIPQSKDCGSLTIQQTMQSNALMDLMLVLSP